MGKSLIIKGADFSENGMKETVIKTTVTKLYDKSGEITSWPNANADTQYYFFSTDNPKLNTGANNILKAITTKIPVEDYTHVKVRTANQGLSYLNSTVAGEIILAAIDSSNNILGGYCTSTAAEQVGSVPLQPVDKDETQTRIFEMDIPTGAAYVVATWDSAANTSGTTRFSPLSETNGFELTLSKIIIE